MQALSTQSRGVEHPEGSGNSNEIDWENITVTIEPHVTQQFVTMYQSLADFDDRGIQHKLNIPKLAFAGEKDTFIYGKNFGNVTVDRVIEEK